MNHPEIFLVLARARNGVIGANGTLPWHLLFPARRGLTAIGVRRKRCLMS